MPERQLTITVRFERRHVVAALVAFILVTICAVSLGISRGAVAVTDATNLCATEAGKVVKRSVGCAQGETAIAGANYRTSALPRKRAVSGRNRMPLPSSNQTRSSELTLQAAEMFENSLTAYTVRYSVPRSWTGKILGSCPAYAPIPITFSAYSPEWSGVTYPAEPGNVKPPVAYVDALSNNFNDVYVERTSAALKQLQRGFDEGWISRDPQLGFTLFITQVCGRAVQLEPTP
jgi:hypothetical protein